jgi:hypothetical protein
MDCSDCTLHGMPSRSEWLEVQLDREPSTSCEGECADRPSRGRENCAHKRQRIR